MLPPHAGESTALPTYSSTSRPPSLADAPAAVSQPQPQSGGWALGSPAARRGRFTLTPFWRHPSLYLPVLSVRRPPPRRSRLPYACPPCPAALTFPASSSPAAAPLPAAAPFPACPAGGPASLRRKQYPSAPILYTRTSGWRALNPNHPSPNLAQADVGMAGAKSGPPLPRFGTGGSLDGGR
jgi:hypothetical protein